MFFGHFGVYVLYFKENALFGGILLKFYKCLVFVAN